MTILLSLSRYTVRGDVSITESSDLRGGIGSLWSVNEGALGMWVQGLEMEPGKRRKRRKRRAWDKGHFCRRHQQASYPFIILGKWAENPWLNIWPWQKCPFPPLGAWMGGGVTSVEGWVFLFILSVCMLVVGVWLCLMRSKDIIDVSTRSPDSTADCHPVHRQKSTHTCEVLGVLCGCWCERDTQRTHAWFHRALAIRLESSLFSVLWALW